MSNFDTMIRAALGKDNLGAVNKFGYNGVVGTTPETVWSAGSIYAYPSAPETMSVSSGNVNDALLGTGAKQVQVDCLIAGYVSKSFTIDMDGQNAVAIPEDVLRVNRIKVLGDQDAQGIIYVGSGVVAVGVPGITYARIEIGENQTLQAVYTVPAGLKALLVNWTASSSRLEEVNVSLKARALDGVFQTKDKLDIYQNVIAHAYSLPIVFEPMTDIELRAVAASSTALVSGKFDLLLIPA